MKLNRACTKCMYEHIITQAQKFCTEDEFYEFVPLVLKNTADQLKQSMAPCEFFGLMYDELSRLLDEPDLYRDEKVAYNNLILSMYKELKRQIDESDYPLRTALYMTVIGNLIDFGVPHEIHPNLLFKLLQEIDGISGIEDADRLLDEMRSAKRILYTGDNCGEVVLDKLFIETINRHVPDAEIVFAYRHKPFSNDVTEQEAIEIGLGDTCRLISTGSEYGGSNYDHCSESYQSFFDRADVRIFKGLANLETAKLEDCDSYFLYMTKCDVQAKQVNKERNEIVIRKGNPIGYGTRQESSGPVTGHTQQRAT